MKTLRHTSLMIILTAVPATIGLAQETAPRIEFTTVAPEKLRPNTKAYLENLKRQLIVTDDPSSRSEVSAAFLRHNFNRISALRSFVSAYSATSESDFVPELSAVNEAELPTLFIENTPKPSQLVKGAVVNRIYRFLGTVRNADTFYIFERLSPFEEEIARGASGTGSATNEKLFLQIVESKADKNVVPTRPKLAEGKRKEEETTSKQIEDSKQLKREIFVEERDRREVFTRPNNPKR